MMTDQYFQGRTIAFLAASAGLEQVELTEPWEVVEDAGGTGALISIDRGPIRTTNDGEPGAQFRADATVGESSVDAYDGLVIPGGGANIDRLASDPGAVTFVRQMIEAGRPVGAIGHGIRVLVAAEVIDDKLVVGPEATRSDAERVGARWSDLPVVVDGLVLTARDADAVLDFTTQLAAALEVHA